MSDHRSAILVGRTNVGKSSLFNRLIGTARAIVSSEPGTTRDINRALVNWRGEEFWLEDSGGFDPQRNDNTGSAVRKQLERAIAKARVVIFVVDGAVGLTPEDRTFTRTVRKLKAHVVLVINKIEGSRGDGPSGMINLGFKDTVLTSARTGRGLGDLLDLVTNHLAPVERPRPSLSIGLFGKTNVGKSSIFNRLVGEERSIVLATPHTTRDKLHEFLTHDNVSLELVDTAGLRRQRTNAPRLEQQSAEQSELALNEVDAALLIINGAEEPTWQDQRLGELIVESRIAAAVIINKSDIVPTEDQEQVTRRLARWLPMVSWAPTLWVSALTGTGCKKIIPTIKAAASSWRKQLSQEDQEKFFKFLKHSGTIKSLTLVSFKQVATSPPRFVLEIRRKLDMPRAVGPWVEGQLRDRFDFRGTPIRVRIEGVRGQA